MVCGNHDGHLWPLVALIFLCSYVLIGDLRVTGRVVLFPSSCVTLNFNIQMYFGNYTLNISILLLGFILLIYLIFINNNKAFIRHFSKCNAHTKLPWQKNTKR